MIAASCSQPRRLWVVLLLSSLCFAGSLNATPQRRSETGSQPDRATAYYHYTLAHLYEQLAGEHMQREYLNRAVEEYEAAIKADPEAGYIRLKLVETYAKFNRLDEAVTEAQKILSEDPRNTEVRKLLGEFYAQYAFDRRGSIDQNMLKSAIEQFERVIEIEPGDQDVLLQLSSLYRAAQNPAKSEEALQKLLKEEPESARGLASLGFLYLDMGDPQRAIEQFEKIREAGQADQRALAGLAQAYEQSGNNAKAAEIYRGFVDEARGNTLPARKAMANNLMMAGRFDEALEQFQILAGAEPENAENHLRLSQIYREKRRFDDARKSLQKAAELAPDDAARLDASYNLVLLLEDEGKSDEAIAALGQLLKDNEKDSYSQPEKRIRLQLLEQLGVLNRTHDHIEPAVKAFNAMAELDEDVRPRARIHVIETYRQGHDFDKALEISKSAVEEFPKNGAVVSMRATVLAETGDAEAGADLLRGLLNDGEQDREVYLSLAQVYEKGRLHDKAIEAAAKAEELAKTDREKIGVWFTYGSVLERAKKFDEAEKKFDAILQLDPDNAAALNYLGYMLADLDRRVDDAHDMIQKALDIDPDNGAYLDSLGWVYYRQERFELAERFLLRSLEQFNSDPVVHSHLADVYYKLGKNAQAKEHWQRSLEEWDRSPEADRDPAEIKKVRDKLAQLETRMSSNTSETKSEKP